MRIKTDDGVELAVEVAGDGPGLLLVHGFGGAKEDFADHVPTLASNLWHFPTVSVNGDAVAKLRGHLRKLQVRDRNSSFRFVAAEKVRHTVTYREVTVEPFRISVKKLPRIKGAEQVPLSEITVLPVSNLTRKVARAILASTSSG